MHDLTVLINLTAREFLSLIIGGQTARLRLTTVLCPHLIYNLRRQIFIAISVEMDQSKYCRQPVKMFSFASSISRKSNL